MMAFKRKNNRGIQTNCKGSAPRIRRQRYSIQPKDLVRWGGKIYRSRGMQNRGTHILLDDGAEKRSPKNIKTVELVFHEKTLYVVN
jgi:hypothetical protein